MSKTIYDDGGDPITDGGTVIKYENIGKYLRSSQENISTISQKVNDIPTNASEILQRADQISLSVNSGYKNYIVSPLAITATKNNSGGTCSIYNSSDLGQVMQIQNTAGQTGYSLTFKIDDNYRQLSKNSGVVVYALVKCINKNTDGYGALRFGWKDNNSSPDGNYMLTVKLGSDGKGDLNNAPTVETAPRKGTTVSNGVGAIQFGTTSWYLCYRAFAASQTLGSDSYREYTINNVQGTWLIHSVGISRDTIPPTIQTVIQNSGFKYAGIDITSGKIELRADNTTITDSTTTSKIEVTSGPDLTGSYNGLETFKIDTYDAGTSSDNVAGAVFTLNEVGQNSNNSQTMIRPQAIIINSGSNTIQIDAYHGRITIRNGGTGTGTAVIRSTSNGYICIDGIPHGYSHFDPIMDTNALYYDDQGYVHIHKPTLQAPAIEDPTGNGEITEEPSGEDTGNT